MAQSRVPPFGSWESAESEMYTIRFETARKAKPGAPTTSSNELNRDEPSPAQAATPRQAKPKPPEFEKKTKASTSEPHLNQAATPSGAKAREGSKYRETEEAIPHKANTGIKPNDSHQRNGGRIMNSGDTRAQPQGMKLVGESSAKQSNLHPRVVVKSSDSSKPPSSFDSSKPPSSFDSSKPPSSFDSSKGRSGKPQHRPSPRGGSNPTGGPTVPEFGNWAESDQFTDVFKEIQREKLGIRTPSCEDANSNNPRRLTQQPKKVCCFSWLFRR